MRIQSLSGNTFCKVENTVRKLAESTHVGRWAMAFLIHLGSQMILFPRVYLKFLIKILCIGILILLNITKISWDLIFV